MPKAKQKTAAKRDNSSSRVRPGFRRLMRNMLHSGKLIALILAVATGALAYDALRSERYRVEVVEAVGAQALTSQDVAALANVKDQPIWYVDTDDIAARVAQSPYVERAQARLFLPDRLQVRITERKPEVRWMHAGQAFAVTWDGLVLDRAAEQQPAAVGSTGTVSNTASMSATTPLSITAPLTASVPLRDTSVMMETAASEQNRPQNGFVSVVTIVDTTPNRTLKVGDHVDADALELARRVILRAPADLPRPIQRIEWDAGLGVSLIVDDGRQVVLGKSDDLDRKIATLRYLMSDNTAFKYLDLRSSTPYYR